MTIKLVFALRERSEHSLEEFQKYWRETHGPLVASFQTVLQMTRYVQVHRTPGEVDDGVRSSRASLNLLTKDPVFDVVDHYWFEGSQNEVVERFKSTEGQKAWKAILQSEQKYIDFENSTLIFVQPRIIIPPREPYLRALPSNSTYCCNGFSEFVPGPESWEHWYDVHAPLCQRLADAVSFTKYMQDHPREVPYVEQMRRDRGMQLESRYKFCTNMWFETRAIYNDATFQAAQEEIRADEVAGFQVPHKLNAFMGKEFYFVDVHSLWY